ncbi:polyketide synthase, partial [Aspergillus flavus]
MGSYIDQTDEGLSPVAVVGMAMRLPGDIRTTEAFWDHIIQKRNASGSVPSTRYCADKFYHPDRSRSTRTTQGYFLSDDPAYFDAAFFSITAHDAARMDPQQRLLLEVIWECLENAGQTSWEGTDTGCFVGTFGEDWLDISHKDPQYIDRYHALGTGAFALSNLVSYVNDFRGPSLTIQTACSSSLVAVHEACQSLITNSCSAAIVAGSNLILTPTMTATMSNNMVLSPSGVCRTFDAAADGYGRGEAINAVFLKRLSDAIRDNDPVRAIIRSTASNCDGRSAILSTPSPESQMALIRTAYRKAKIDDIADTGLFECHGTGTIAGDKAEATALAGVLEGKGGILGAVKPNFGHSEGASGITSMIKAVLSLEHNIIPPTALFETPSPCISFEQDKLVVPTQVMEWPEHRRKRASVNGFGIGGANAHVILESCSEFGIQGEADTEEAPINTAESREKPWLLVVSAKDKASLESRISQVAEYMNKHPGSLQDLSYTLGSRRKHLPHRAFAIGDGQVTVGASDFRRSEAKSPTNIHFAFTGQGSQWPGMGKALMQKYPGVRSDIKLLEHALAAIPNPPSWSLEEKLCELDGSETNNPEFSQPLSTAIQICLVNLLATWGIKPASVVGHSSGEIAAAYSSGAITASSAIILAYYRGKLASCHKGTGDMASVGLSQRDILPYLEDGVVVGCENSRQSVTISGEKGKVNHIVNRIRDDFPDAFCRKLHVDIAYHSPYMAALGPQYESMISGHIELSKARAMVPMFSSVVPGKITDPCTLDAGYWRRNLESCVLFHEAVKMLVDEWGGHNIVVEIGPHHGLSGPLRQIFQEYKPRCGLVYIPTLTRNDPDCETQLLSVAGRVHSEGAPIDFLSIHGPGRVVTDLPPYPWQHETRHWNENRLARDWRLHGESYHELLGFRCTEVTDLEPSWRNVLHLEDVSWLSEHVLQGQVVFPAAAYIAMAGEAIQQLSRTRQGYSVRNVIFKSPLILDDSASLELVTSLKRVMLNDLTESDWYAFSIMAHADDGWIKACIGYIRPGAKDNDESTLREPSVYSRSVSSERIYRAFSNMGLFYGPRFQGLRDITADPCGGRSAATVNNWEEDFRSHYTVHPTVLDQCLQLIGVAGSAGLERRIAQAAIPASLESLCVTNCSKNVDLKMEAVCEIAPNFQCSTTAISEGKAVIVMHGARFFNMGYTQRNETGTHVPLAAQINWKPDINFQAPQNLLPATPFSNIAELIVQETARLSFLYILETAQKIRDVEPRVPHLHKWKNWVMKQASRISEGRQELFPESHEWASWTSAQRQKYMEKIHLSCKDLDEDGGASPACMEAIFNNCLDIMDGTASAMSLLMEGGLIEGFYRTAQKVCDWDRFLNLLCHSNPSLRILEVGAGTGTATAQVLQSLNDDGIPMYAKYTFTDISPAFLRAAREKFSNVKNMEYKVLDISQDPKDQGYNSHEYDLVIASNVLHATPKLRDSLVNVHELLAPNGRLILHELQPDIPTVDFIMGTLPAWWIGEMDGRRDAPYVSPERWDQELRDAGFQGVEAVMHDLKPPFQASYTMLSSISGSSSSKMDVTLLISESPGEWAGIVFQELTALGYNVRWATLHDKPVENNLIISLLDVEEPFLHSLSSQRYESLLRYLLNIEGCRLIWVTRLTQYGCIDPNYALVPGFARSLRRELSLLLYTFEVDVFNTEAARALSNIVSKAEEDHNKPHGVHEYEFILYDGCVHIGRCHWGVQKPEKRNTPMPSQSDGVMKLTITTPALLDTLQWVKAEDSRLGEQDVEIDMQYIGLNFRDIMVSMGLVGSKDQLGIEGTGVIRRIGNGVRDLLPGDEVIVMSSGLLRTRVIIDRKRCFKLPRGMSLHDGATMTSVFATAIYSLLHVGQLRKGQIFATVGNEEKVEYLVKHHGIPRTSIFNSRNASFRESLMKATNGRGVDIVLNSLAGELLHASWECVAQFGKMIELGKRDFLTNGMLSLNPFAGNRAFFGVDLLQLTQCDMEVFNGLVRQFEAWYVDGKIQPIQSVTHFDASKVSEAFRFLQRGTHIGKVVLAMPHDGISLPPGPDSQHHVEFSPDASYLLVGGLGGVGRAISTWMVENGARHLTYLSRSAGTSPADKAFIKELQELGCSVECVRGSVAIIEDVRKAITRCRMPLKGVFQMSLSLEDRPFPDMKYDEWKAALAPKVQGTWNLHDAVADIQLDYFVLFGSLVGTCGRPHQVNYAAANSFLEGFSQYRQQLGLPCSVLSLGPIEEVGVVSRDPKMLQTMRGAGIWLLSEAELLEGLRLALLECQFPSSNLEAPSKVGTLPDKVSAPLLVGLGSTRPIADSSPLSLWGHDIRFSRYAQLNTSESQEGSQSRNSALRDLIAGFRADPSTILREDTRALLKQELCLLITTYSVAAQEIDAEERLQMQIDSLMSIEIRSWVRCNMQLDVSLPDISKAKTFG